LKKQIMYVPRSELEGHCTGCRLCELMCSLQHNNTFNPDRARIRVTSFEGGIDVPSTCTQCGLCLDKCPLDLIKLNQTTGAIEIDEEKCTSCMVCVEWCPVGAITIDPVTRKALKCDLCAGSPQCVKYCPSKVLQTVDLSSTKAVNSRRRIFASVLAGEEQLQRKYNIVTSIPARERALSIQKTLSKGGK
jgi:carbon-monoxide dehydrogenase iron sulfur subunit